MSMRGLTVFISDLRNCRARELEEKRVNKELANIRSKFKDPNLNGYQKKKYVCKLLYMYILGWDIDFGHMEAINLLSSQKFTEKQIGYLAITLMLSENNELIRLVVNSMKRDLDDPDELFSCLAIHAIANIGAKEMAETLVHDIYRLLTKSPSRFVKKKASLCLLRLYRKHPEVIPAADWAPRLIAMMDDPDMGVSLCVTTFVLVLVQNFPGPYYEAAGKAIRKLYKIVHDKEYTTDYVYYKVPVPWIQVKLLRLLQYYPPPNDSGLSSLINTVLQTIIKNAHEIPKNVQHNNAQNAIFFEAVGLAIHIDSESDLIAQATRLLGKFISSKETNVRYLGLETMAHIATVSRSLETIQQHQETIIESLKDKDISVRRRALDLLYCMCDGNNSRTIVSELLQYLPIADFAIREEIVLKIAILTEKFTVEPSWYLDVVLQLITIAGDHVSEDIWYRVVQIVTNNENLQEYAATTVLTALRSPTCHETALKVGGYILGECGYLIANKPGCAPMDQFSILHSKFGMCSASTRALLMTTYLKFVNLFPEIKDEIMRVFQQYRYVLDVELQQRACEYFNIVSLPTEDILQAVCDEMPPFPERESALVLKLNKKIAETEEKRPWQMGILANQEKKEDRRRSLVRMNEEVSNAATATQASAVNYNGPDDLLGLEVVSQPSAQQQQQQPGSFQDDPLAKYEQNLQTLIIESNGILFENSVIQIGIKSEYQSQLGRIAVYYGNKSAGVISNLSTSVEAPPGLKITLTQPIPGTIPPANQFNQVYNLECLNSFDSLPGLTVSFMFGPTNVTLPLQLPIALTKFLSPVELNSVDFFARWRQIGGAPRETQSIFKARSPIDPKTTKRILAGLKLDHIEGIDPNPLNTVSGAVFNSIEIGKVGCLMRVEPNMEQQLFRLTIRATNENVSQHLQKLVETALASA
ncbi:Adaptor protein complex AP-2 alpha subunit [Polychytrium aggregatum]|uniref:Adaptor protein complex AP-2 alpha subunit n=1 Tax=Polychytrium aggregatum TaxID=110093 RepID=UPI0022FEF00A|nr:Adaptor protein complex AP-2 alpha subunit [Polychytrium aggregatum]KAI9202948.1 Adaptor protein complex AP-2 alpha subunit [Polychytrium aggregatum]